MENFLKIAGCGHLIKEFSNGNDGSLSRNDGDVVSELISSALHTPKSNSRNFKIRRGPRKGPFSFLGLLLQSHFSPNLRYHSHST
jgi:hypothetical protein